MNIICILEMICHTKMFVYDDLEYVKMNLNELILLTVKQNVIIESVLIETEEHLKELFLIHVKNKN